MKQLTDYDVTQFDRTTTLTPVAGSDNKFTVDLDPSWASLVGAHGGYMVALAVRAAEAAAPDRKVRTVNASFLRPGQTGPATVTVSPVRSGRSMSTFVVDLEQPDRHVLTTRLTLVVESTGVEWSQPVDLGLPPFEQCVPIDSPNGVSHFDQAIGFLDPASIPFTNGERARVSGYFRPLPKRPIDAAWLAMAVDWFPPPAFVRVDPPTGGISIDLTAHIHRERPPLDDNEWLMASFEITQSTRGLAVEHGVIADHDGTILAEVFQTRYTAQIGQS